MKPQAASNLTPASAPTPTAADRLYALAEPMRLRVVRILEMQELTVGELAKALQLPQSSLSRRLKILSQAGWLTHRNEGAATLYQFVLDDQPPLARDLWLAVRNQAATAEQAAQDDRRLESVLDQRRLDSRAYFGKVAGEWDDVRGDLFGTGFTPVALLGLLDPEWTVADLGCGTGNVSQHLAPMVKAVLAIDQSEPMLDAARKRLARFHNIEFRAGDLESLPIDDVTIDAAITMLVLHHLAEPASAIAEACRTLKPGGVLLIVDMVAHDRDEYRRTMGHQRLGFAEREITTFLTSAGLERVRFTPLPSHPNAKGPGLFLATGRRPEK